MEGKAKQEILKLVKEISKTSPSGEQFFDELDERIKSSENKWILFEGVRSIPKSHTLILSGGMGDRVARGIDLGDLPSYSYILFKGGIRKSGKVEIVKTSGQMTNDATFFDDSIYGGLTFFKIKGWLKETKGKYPVPNKCFVIYDGCPEKRDFVDSLFRYYDFFKATPNYKF